MRQVMIHEFGGLAAMRVEEEPQPQPAAGEVLADVHFAGLNPIDYKMRDGSSGMCRRMTLPCGLGREFAGQVVAAGPGVDLDELGLPEGSWVFGIRDHTDTRGCYAEQITINAHTLAPIPADGDVADLSHWAGLALVGLTAMDALDRARLAPGETVLVHGGSGGVGQMLIPMALARGAEHVWATGRAVNAERIRQLGATPIPYDGINWREAIDDATDGRGVDVVLDTHYFETFIPSLDHLADGGRIVALPTLADLTPAHARGIEAAVPGIEPTRAALDHLARAFVAGDLPLEVSEVIAMDEVQRAHRQLEHGHTRGKLILDVSA